MVCFCSLRWWWIRLSNTRRWATFMQNWRTKVHRSQPFPVLKIKWNYLLIKRWHFLCFSVATMVNAFRNVGRCVCVPHTYSCIQNHWTCKYIPFPFLSSVTMTLIVRIKAMKQTVPWEIVRNQNSGTFYFFFSCYSWLQQSPSIASLKLFCLFST